jgi:hypothetical protein
MKNSDIKISLAPGAESNGLAVMLGDLVRQNLEAKPRKKRDFHALEGAVAIVAEDAEVALTLVFHRASLVIHDGIVGIPDVTVRAGSEVILALSNLPITRPLGLPLPGLKDLRDKGQVDALRTVFASLRAGTFQSYGAAFHPGLMMRLTRVMSVNG